MKFFQYLGEYLFLNRLFGGSHKNESADNQSIDSCVVADDNISDESSHIADNQDISTDSYDDEYESYDDDYLYDMEEQEIEDFYDEQDDFDMLDDFF